MKLTEGRDPNDIAAVKSALSAEKNLEVQVDIASALWNAGEPTGLSQMESMCTDSSLPLPITGRVTVQLAMANLSHPQPSSVGKCADVLLPALERTDDRDWWIEVLGLLKFMYPDVAKSQAERMVLDAQNLLWDQDTTVRMLASRALAEMGSASSLEFIRGAMLREEGPVVRSSMQRDVLALEKLK